MRQPCPGHPLAEAAFFDEVPLQGPDLAVEEVVRLVDETDGDVGQHLRRPVFEKGP